MALDGARGAGDARTGGGGRSGNGADGVDRATEDRVSRALGEARSGGRDGDGGGRNGVHGAAAAVGAAAGEARAGQDRLAAVGAAARRGYEARGEAERARAADGPHGAAVVLASTGSGAESRPAARPDPEPPYAPTPPPDTVLQRLRETVASQAGLTVGEAQAAIGWVGDMLGAAAAAVETGYEAAVAAIEAATCWIGDAHARKQRDDLAARAEGLLEAAEEVLSDPEAVVAAFAASYDARFTEADALEAAYRSGHADLSAYREAERMRGQARAELGIMAGEAAAAVVGVGAAAKALRTARIADRIDGATPVALAMATTQRARAGAEAVELLTAQPGRRRQIDAEEIAEVAEARVRSPEITDAVVGTGLWQRAEVAGRRVYQRDDLIDPKQVHQRSGLTNLERMEQGLAPIGPDGEPLNLHHMIQDEPGPMAEVTTTFHQENYRSLHLYTNQYDKMWKGEDGERRPYQSAPASMDRAGFDTWRADYWTERAEDFR